MLSTSTAHSSSDLTLFSKAMSSASPATVSTRVVTGRRTSNILSSILPEGALKITARPATPVASSSSLDESTGKKRNGPTIDTPHAKKQRLSASPSASAARSRSVSSDHSRASSSAPSRHSPAPNTQRFSTRSHIASGSRSRSTSVLHAVDPQRISPRECWIAEDGRPIPGLLSSEIVVKDLMRSYKAYFSNPVNPKDWSYQPHPTNYPRAELEYPNTGACERFILLAPKDKDHYNPIMCLVDTLYTIIECYLTPAQQALFGTLPNNNFTDDDTLDETIPSQRSTPESVCSESSAWSKCSIYSDASSISTLSSLAGFSTHDSQTRSDVNYLKLLRRAISTRDGPLFQKVMAAINTLLRFLKYPPLPPDIFEAPAPNHFREAVKTWTTTGIPTKVVDRIIHETYQRAVGPHTAELSRYEAFSSEVYGELLPGFVSDIINATGLREDSLFVDLGSGVGNVVLQASLQTGCSSFGVEIMPGPARIARNQAAQFKMRCQMWGLKMGDIELEEGDMLKSSRVDELVAKADVVLVNNKVFLESLNEALRSKFLDLKEGAFVVSLKPFVSSTRLTERNLDDISAIFQVEERAYSPGSVSWGNGGGSYYLHRVDREGYADIKQQLLRSSRTASSRNTRSRR